MPQLISKTQQDFDEQIFLKQYSKTKQKDKRYYSIKRLSKKNKNGLRQQEETNNWW